MFGMIDNISRVDETTANDATPVPSPEIGLIETSAHGEVVPSPRFPTAPSKKNGDIPEFPNRTVDEVYNPPCSWSAVVVEFTLIAAYKPASNGKLPPVSVPHTSTPPVFAFTSQFAAERFAMVSEVVVALVKIPPVAKKKVEVALVRMELVAKRLVEVALVVVPKMESKLKIVEDAVA